MTEFPIGLDDIRSAAQRLAAVAVRTPLLPAPRLSRRFGYDIWLKLENLQVTGSYKIRGAFNNIAQLDEGVRQLGVVAASAGNHAQGVAFSARHFGVAPQSVVFVPTETPIVKREATKAYGVEVRLEGANFDETKRAALAFSEAEGRAFIHPFDDWATIAGQGTIGLEIAEQIDRFDAVVVPIGGGGLISGIALALRDLAPNVEVFGVQARGAAAMQMSVSLGTRTTLLQPPQTLADGIQVAEPGEKAFRVVSDLIGAARLLTVSEREITAAMADLAMEAKVVAEGAGAVALAGLISAAGQRTIRAGIRVVVVVSGGNSDPGLLQQVFYDQLISGRIFKRMRVHLNDKPGKLVAVLMRIALANINVRDIAFERQHANDQPATRTVDIEVEVDNVAHLQGVIDELRRIGIDVEERPPE